MMHQQRWSQSGSAVINMLLTNRINVYCWRSC